jgi:hypothetical protein
LTKWLQEVLAVLGNDPVAQLNIHCSNGRMLLRRRGYRIPPHRDPKWGFITCLMYLARKKDDQRWERSCSPSTVTRKLWAEATLDFGLPVSSRARRLVSPESRADFPQFRGAHGAQIPADAEPADLERYALQFRIGPDRRSMESVCALLPAEQEPFWAGKGGDY